MSDLLASLVDRALDRAPVLQRRQPALFEPIGEAAFGEHSQIKSAAALPEEESVVERDHFPRERKPHPDGDPSPFPAPALAHEPTQPDLVRPRAKRPRRTGDDIPLEEDYAQHSRRKPSPAATGIESPASPILRAEQPSRGSISPAIAKPETSMVQPQNEIETIVEKRIEREIVYEFSRDSTANKDAASFSPQIINSREPARAEDDRAAAPLKTEVKPLSSPKEEAAIKPLTQKTPAPRRETAAVLRATARVASTRSVLPPTPPTIHVTIGRVEVRATPQAATRMPAARPAGPRLSLDDYLRSRGEGK